MLCGCNRTPSVDKQSLDSKQLNKQSPNSAPLDPNSTRSNAETNPEKRPPTTGASDADLRRLENQLRGLISERTATGELKEENLAKLVALVPELKSRGLFWKWVGAVPPSQLDRFREAIVSSLRELTLFAGRSFGREIRNAYYVAGDLRDSEVARIAFEQLPMAPAYSFPLKTMPPGWPGGNPDDLEHLLHGDQGLLASTVTEFGDKSTLAAFRENLKQAPPERQRLMIWALGRSSELEDFDLLMSLRSKIVDPGAFDTLVRALNRIPQSMERTATYSDTTSPERRPSDPAKMLQTAAACRQRLAELKLVIPLTMFD